jgi:hypothetical protein
MAAKAKPLKTNQAPARARSHIPCYAALCDDDHMEPVFWQNTLPIMMTILVATGGALVSSSHTGKRLVHRSESSL